MIVVSDTSPIRALFHLRLLPLCGELYARVLVPEAVRVELLRPTTPCPALDITVFGGFEIRPDALLSDSVASRVSTDLDAGETQAIALALEVGAQLLLIDERKGTAAARELGLSTIGVFGVLLEAKRKGLVMAVVPLVDRLVADLRFFVSPTLRRRLAELAEESVD